jgi:chromate reductase, NAD(P)H dehydrogenase (quinone)
VLHRIQAHVVPHPEIMIFRFHERFDPDGTLMRDEVTEELLRQLLVPLPALIRLSRAARPAEAAATAALA